MDSDKSDAAPERPAISFPPNAVHLVRTNQQITMQLSQMADQKASILMGATFVVFTLVYMVNPGYMSDFFVDQRLIVAGLGGLCWMSIGVFIMAKMVNFEI